MAKKKNRRKGKPVHQTAQNMSSSASALLAVNAAAPSPVVASGAGAASSTALTVAVSSALAAGDPEDIDYEDAKSDAEANAIPRDLLEILQDPKRNAREIAELFHHNPHAFQHRNIIQQFMDAVPGGLSVKQVLGGINTRLLFKNENDADLPLVKADGQVDTLVVLQQAIHRHEFDPNYFSGDLYHRRLHQLFQEAGAFVDLQLGGRLKWDSMKAQDRVSEIERQLSSGVPSIHCLPSLEIIQLIAKMIKLSDSMAVHEIAAGTGTLARIMEAYYHLYGWGNIQDKKVVASDSFAEIPDPAQVQDILKMSLQEYNKQYKLGTATCASYLRAQIEPEALEFIKERIATSETGQDVFIIIGERTGDHEIVKSLTLNGKKIILRHPLDNATLTVAFLEKVAAIKDVHVIEIPIHGISACTGPTVGATGTLNSVMFICNKNNPAFGMDQEAFLTALRSENCPIVNRDYCEPATVINNLGFSSTIPLIDMQTFYQQYFRGNLQEFTEFAWCLMEVISEVTLRGSGIFNDCKINTMDQLIGALIKVYEPYWLSTSQSCNLLYAFLSKCAACVKDHENVTLVEQTNVLEYVQAIQNEIMRRTQVVSQDLLADPGLDLFTRFIATLSEAEHEAAWLLGKLKVTGDQTARSLVTEHEGIVPRNTSKLLQAKDKNETLIDIFSVKYVDTLSAARRQALLDIWEQGQESTVFQGLMKTAGAGAQKIYLRLTEPPEVLAKRRLTPLLDRKTESILPGSGLEWEYNYSKGNDLYWCAVKPSANISSEQILRLQTEIFQGYIINSEANSKGEPVLRVSFAYVNRHKAQLELPSDVALEVATLNAISGEPGVVVDDGAPVEEGPENATRNARREVNMDVARAASVFNAVSVEMPNLFPNAQEVMQSMRVGQAAGGVLLQEAKSSAQFEPDVMMFSASGQQARQPRNDDDAATIRRSIAKIRAISRFSASLDPNTGRPRPQIDKRLK